jgi:pilus assembly protein Flp/PilA
MERIEMFLTWLRLGLSGQVEREEGQTMIEYGLIVALISIVAILTLTTVGTNIQDVFDSIAGKLHS